MIKKENVGQILQDIYESEINMDIGWLWDGGVDASIPYGEKDIIEVHGNTIVEALTRLVDEIMSKFPKSEFAKKYKD